MLLSKEINLLDIKILITDMKLVQMIESNCYCFAARLPSCVAALMKVKYDKCALTMVLMDNYGIIFETEKNVN